MITIEQIKNFFLKNGRNIIVILLVLLSVYQCSNSKEQRLAGANDQLEKSFKEKKQILKEQEAKRVQLKDSFNREIKKITDKENIAKDKIVQLTACIGLIQHKLDNTKEEIKTYTSSQSSNAFNKRYGPGSATADSSSVVLKNNVPKKVLTDLAIKDALEDNIVIKDSIISEKDKIIEGKTEAISMQAVELQEAEITIGLGKDALKTSEELSKDLNNQIKAQKVKNTIVKILVPLAFIGGLLIAN